MNKVTLNLTRIYLRLTGGKFLRLSKVLLPDGEEVEAVVFSSTNDALLGQASITGAILIHEKALRPSYLRDYVLAHEAAHRRRWYSYLAFPITGVFGMGSFGYLTLGFAMLGAAIAGREGALYMFLVSLGFSLVLFAVPCAYSWFIEYKADSEAVRRLGVNAVLRAYAHLKTWPKPPLFWRIWARISRPPIAVTIRVCRFFNRNLKD